MAPGEHWDPVIASLRAKMNGWNRLGLAIFGRTLVLNSCLIAKATFKSRNADPTEEQR